MTPGVEETLQRASAHCGLGPEALVLEVAYGKGEAACRLAAGHGCRVVGVDLHSMAAYSKQKAGDRGLQELVSLMRADGGRLPFRREAFELALCTGAPSIVGTERCLAEMHRVLRPGGWAVVSDWVWRRTPIPPAAVPWSWKGDFILVEEYASHLRRAGFEVVLAQTLPDRVWDDYYSPMLAAGRETEELRTFYEGGGREYWGYGVFIGRKRA